MKFFTALAGLFALAANARAAAIEPRDLLLDCGEHRYRPHQYTCYPDNKLCPIRNGVIHQPCGVDPSGPCFNPAEFGCTDGQLHGIKVCNGQRYNTHSHVCSPNQLGGEQLCSVDAPNACGTACYSATDYTCDNGRLRTISNPCPSPNAPVRCGNMCYPETPDAMCGNDVYMVPSYMCSRYDFPV